MLDLIYMVCIVIWVFNAYLQYKELDEYGNKFVRTSLSILLPLLNLITFLVVWVKKKDPLT